MKAIVLDVSVFGNTKQVAQGIADSLASRADVELLLAQIPHRVGKQGVTRWRLDRPHAGSVRPSLSRRC